MMTSYLPDQMLRNLALQPMTRTQQREVDDQLGSAAASVTRFAQRLISSRTKATQGTNGGHSVRVFRNQPQASPHYARCACAGTGQPA